MHPRIRKLRSVRRAQRRLGLRRFLRNETGVQLAELAIVLPMLLLMFGAVAEFGRYFYEYTTLAKATRAGARYMVIAAVNEDEIDNVKSLVVYGNTTDSGQPLIDGLTKDNVHVTARNAAGMVITAGVPQTITVEIDGFQHKSLINLGGLMKSETFSLNIAVKPRTTMRYLINTPLV